MKWFKHDTDASIDAKLQELLLDYGASGYGLYWYCVELIAQNISDTNITFELEHDARIIARNLNLTVQETKDMMQKMIKLELFSISKNDKLACYALAKRLDQSMTSNSKFRNLISQIKTSSHDKVMIESEPPLDKVMQEEKRREEIRKEEKREEREETSHTPFSFQEQIKEEHKPVINQDLKSMISKQAKSENKVTDIINYYRDNVSGRNEDIQEMASYNQILIKNYDMDKMLIGLENYKRYLEVSKKAPMKLFFFIRDAIYNDYQVENVVSTGKNIAVVPIDLVGKRFVIQGEEIEFENDGYNKVGKDWKVTNSKNVEEMVRLVRGMA